VLVLFTLYFFLAGSQVFFEPLGILDIEDSFILSTFVAIPIILGFHIMWEHFVLEVPIPLSSQVFLHPKIIHHWFMKLWTGLVLIRCLLFYFDYGVRLSFAVSVGLSLIFLYVFTIVMEIAAQMAKDERAKRPFKQEV